FVDTDRSLEDAEVRDEGRSDRFHNETVAAEAAGLGPSHHHLLDRRHDRARCGLCVWKGDVALVATVVCMSRAICGYDLLSIPGIASLTRATLLESTTKRPAQRRPFAFPDGRSDLDQRPLRRRGFRAAAGATVRATGLRRLAPARARQFLGLRRDRTFDELEADLVQTRALVLDHDDADMAAALQLAEQYLVGQRLLDVLLDHARHRPRAHLLVIAVLDQPGLGRIRQLDGDVAVGELRLELQHELLHDHADHVGIEMGERDDGVEAIAEFRRELPVDRLVIVAFALA